MYESFFGLRARPFSLVPDPNFLYLSRHHRNGLKMLEHSLREQASFTLISGEVGTGKTVMVRKFLQMLSSNTSVGLVTNTHESIGSLIEWILLSFGLDYRGRDKIELYDILNQHLQDQRRNNRPSLLIIDEAQNLSISALEELRMLSNVNEDKNLILQIILVGQLEILEKLNRPDLRQLAQRISVNFRLDPLNLVETYRYIRHRIKVAGGRPKIFDDAACAAIYQFSNGLPRLINVICEAALVYAFGEGDSQVTAENVLDAMEDRQRSGLRDVPTGLLDFDREAVKRDILDTLASHPLYEGLEGDQDFALGLNNPEEEELGVYETEFVDNDSEGARLQREILVAISRRENEDSRFGEDGDLQSGLSPSERVLAVPIQAPHLADKQAKAKQPRKRKSSGAKGSWFWRPLKVASIAIIFVSLAVIGVTIFDKERRVPALFAEVTSLLPQGDDATSQEVKSPEESSESASAPQETITTTKTITDTAPESIQALELTEEVIEQNSALGDDMPEIAVNTQKAALPQDAEPSGELSATIADMLMRDQDDEFYDSAFLGLFERWGLDYDGLPGQTPCIKARAKGLDCHEMFGDWQAVKEMNLPALIQLTSANGRRVYAVISNIEDDSADFKIGDKTLTGDQSDILPYWDGNFLVLERGEFDYRGNLQRGSSGRNVAWIRSHLSAYYGTSLPPGNQYDYDLFKLVLQYQRDHGLAADGIVGVKTHASILKMIRAQSVPKLQESAKLE